MSNNEIISELKKAVGERYISDQPELTYLYHYDFITAEPEGRCDIVIIPGSAEEVQEIVKIGNKYKIKDDKIIEFYSDCFEIIKKFEEWKIKNINLEQ